MAHNVSKIGLQDNFDVSGSLPSFSAPVADDLGAFDLAHVWIENFGPEVADNDRHAAAEFVAAKVRDGFGSITETKARDLVEFWSNLCCSPSLVPFEIEQIVSAAYSGWRAVPEAVPPVAEAKPSDIGQPVAQVAPSPQPCVEPVPPPNPHKASVAAKERMARRRAELKRLGLPAKHKGSLRSVTPSAPVTPSTVTPVTPSTVTPSAPVTPITPLPPAVTPSVTPVTPTEVL